MLRGKLAVGAEREALFMENSGAVVAARQLAVFATDAVRGKTSMSYKQGREKGRGGRPGVSGNVFAQKRERNWSDVIGNTIAKYRQKGYTERIQTWPTTKHITYSYVAKNQSVCELSGIFCIGVTSVRLASLGPAVSFSSRSCV